MVPTHINGHMNNYGSPMINMIHHPPMHPSMYMPQPSSLPPPMVISPASIPTPSHPLPTDSMKVILDKLHAILSERMSIEAVINVKNEFMRTFHPSTLGEMVNNPELVEANLPDILSKLYSPPGKQSIQISNDKTSVKTITPCNISKSLSMDTNTNVPSLPSTESCVKSVISTPLITTKDNEVFE